MIPATPSGIPHYKDYNAISKQFSRLSHKSLLTKKALLCKPHKFIKSGNKEKRHPRIKKQAIQIHFYIIYIVILFQIFDECFNRVRNAILEINHCTVNAFIIGDLFSAMALILNCQYFFIMQEFF